jgi:Holliday junction resolvase RusA-like endonuclease
MIKYNKTYTLWIPGEPVPKSTQKPPNVHSKRAQMEIIDREDKYKPIRKTLQYQREVAWEAQRQGIPKFSKDDPIAISITVCKGKHAQGDMKNHEAAIEDGLQYGGFIPNDRQITFRLQSRIEFYCDEPGVWVHLRIDPRALSVDFLLRWFKNNKKKTREYYKERFGEECVI